MYVHTYTAVYLEQRNQPAGSLPVSHLVHESIALVVRGRRSAVHAGPQIHHTIICTARIGTREGGPTQQTALEFGEENVEGGLITPAVGGLDVDRAVLGDGRTVFGDVLAVVGSRRVGVLILNDFNVEAEIGTSVDVGIHQRRLLIIDHGLRDALVENVKVRLDGNVSGLEHATIALHVFVLEDEMVGCLALRLGGIGRLATCAGRFEIGPGRPRAGRSVGTASVGRRTVAVAVASALQTTDAVPVSMVVIMVMVVVAMVMVVMSVRDDTGRRGKEGCGSLNELHGDECVVVVVISLRKVGYDDVLLY